MDTGLKGKTVLITGASRNMGRLAAIAFAREGANLALCTSTKMKELNEVADEARALGAKVVAQRCDVASEGDVSNFIAKARDELGTVHVAINNAVNRGAEGPFLEESYEAWVTNFEVNLTGPRNVCRHVLPLMQEQRWGRIINLSGTSPFLGGSVSKGMAKVGIIGFTRGIAREFAAHEITANCIGPGTIDVERDDFQKPKGLKAGQPIRRLGKPGEIVSMMVYLSSENAGFITGQCYLVNGGMYFQ
ncbi:MAG: SDR family oxidoreductase [Betaproteobacteria bacterium]|nr:SDR family oxidoreductase [Betaproteobacteria bacterium]